MRRANQKIAAFAAGFASVLSLGSNLAPVRSEKMPRRPRRSDAANIRGDWERVGGDLKKAAEKASSAA